MIDPAFTENPAPIHAAVLADPCLGGGQTLLCGCGDGPTGALLTGGFGAALEIEVRVRAAVLTLTLPLTL